MGQVSVSQVCGEQKAGCDEEGVAWSLEPTRLTPLYILLSGSMASSATLLHQVSFIAKPDTIRSWGPRCNAAKTKNTKNGQ